MPENLDALLYLGILQLERGDFLKARAWFEKILAIQPHHTEALYHLGSTYFAEKEFERALPLFQSVLQQAPHHLKACYQLSLTYSRLDRTDEAQRAMKTFKELEATATNPVRTNTAFGKRYRKQIGATKDQR